MFFLYLGNRTSNWRKITSNFLKIELQMSLTQFQSQQINTLFFCYFICNNVAIACARARKKSGHGKQFRAHAPIFFTV